MYLSEFLNLYNLSYWNIKYFIIYFEASNSVRSNPELQIHKQNYSAKFLSFIFLYYGIGTEFTIYKIIY
jgi:hypothetical protein